MSSISAGRFAVLLVALLVVLAVPGTASARSCGDYDTTDSATIVVDVYQSATCSYGFATASRFYAADGIPTRLTVLGTRLVYGGFKRGAGWHFWWYTGKRHGRFVQVFITEIFDAPALAPPASPPVIPYPGRGYPVVCADGSISNSGGIQGACSYHGGVG